MQRWRSHLAKIARVLCCSALALCTGCPAPYPGVPHEELADRILEPPLPAYQQPPDAPPVSPEHVGVPPESQTQANGRAAKSSVRVASAAGISRSDSAASNVRQASFNPREALPAPDDAPVPPNVGGATNPPKSHDAEVVGTPPPANLIDGNTLTLATAIDLAYRNNPEIQKAHARLNLAHAGKDVAYADFLPGVDGGYRFIGGDTRPSGFVLPTVASDIGNVAFGAPAQEVGMAELRAQWTVWDFGRTMSKYGQSLVGEQIAGLQYVRTQQTVAFEVTKAYFEALDANAAAEVAEEAVKRAQSALNDAKHYLNRGNALRNDVLRANVFLKDMQLELVKAKTAEGVAMAKLNQTMGMNSADAPQLVELGEPPRFEKSLRECLQCAVENRQEFGVVEHGIANAKLGQNIAEAEFMPKVVVGGLGALEAQRDASKDAQHASAGIAIEMGLFQGGRLVGELRGSHAEVDLAVASGKQVCDQIAFEVKVAFLAIDDAKERIDVSRAAAAQASENLRVIKSQFDQGDAIPTDIIEAELGLTRAQQGYLIATYDYETALASLAYAVGLPPESFLAMPCAR
jgi:outer membrane protein